MDETPDPLATTSSMSDPRVEAVVCVHNTLRPVERAVASALRNTIAVRVTVVVHNADIDGVRDRLGALCDDDRLRVLELRDGVRSPANAFNFALDNATGEFISLIGSDDELAPHALDAWVELADRVEADVVVAPIRRIGGGAVPSPRVRPHRTSNLDGDRDRLFERTAPLGLVRLGRFPGLRFSEGLPRGVDQVFGLHVWFSGARVAFDPSTPAYLEWDDQIDRVTKAGGPLADDLAYLDEMEEDPVFRAMSPAARRAVAVKIIRVHLIAAIATRITTAGLTPGDRQSVAMTLTRLRGWAPRVVGLLAVRDRRVLTAALDPTSSGDRLRKAIGDRSRYLTPGALITLDPLRLLHRHAPFRSLAAGRRVAVAVEAAAAAVAVAVAVADGARDSSRTANR